MNNNILFYFTLALFLKLYILVLCVREHIQSKIYIFWSFLTTFSSVLKIEHSITRRL